MTADAVAMARQILRLATAFTCSRVLQCALQLGVFDLLAGGAVAEPELCAGLELDRRLARGFLEVLVALGLLERDDSGRYGNTAAASEHLVAGPPGYLGDAVLDAAAADARVWSQLAGALRGEQPVPQPAPERPGVRAMTGAAIARGLDWLRYRDFVELSGPDPLAGSVAAQVTAVHTHLRCWVVERGAPVPATDVVIVGPRVSAADIETAYGTIRRGGALLVYGLLPDVEGDDPYTLLAALSHLLTRPDSPTTTAAEVWQHATAAGFTVERVRDLDAAGEDRMLIARKPTAD